MPVMTVKLHEVNFLAGAARSYALVAVAGELLFIDAQCPHRGGPLHLGSVDRDARGRHGMRCPWHGTFVPIARLRKTSLPMVVRPHTGEAAVIVPPGSDLTAMLRHPHTAPESDMNLRVRAAPCLGCQTRSFEP
jgi:nitrite reductase (NADH) small subunit